MADRPDNLRSEQQRFWAELSTQLHDDLADDFASEARSSFTLIWISGPENSEKYHVANKLAQELGFTLFEPEDVFRTVAFLATESGLDVAESEPVERFVQEMEVTLGSDDTLYGNGNEIRSSALTNYEMTEKATLLKKHEGVKNTVESWFPKLCRGRKVIGESEAIPASLAGLTTVEVLLTASTAESSEESAISEQGNREISDTESQFTPWKAEVRDMRASTDSPLHTTQSDGLLTKKVVDELATAIRSILNDKNG